MAMSFSEPLWNKRASRSALLSGLAWLATCACGALAAETPALAPPRQDTELAKALWYDSEITLHPRFYYLDRLTPTPQGPAGFAGGGWLGYRSGWLLDVFRVGIVGYTSQPIWGPTERDGSLLFKPGPEGYTVLGEAYGSIKLFDQTFTAFRQRINEPEVNPRDIRMTPNTFEAYALQGKFGDLSYFAGYVDKIKPINQDRFLNMAEQAGAPIGVSEGMWLGTLSYSPSKTLTARVSSYHVPNILTSSYTDFGFEAPLAADAKLKLGAQFMYQSSTGNSLLTGSPFSTWSGGAKADLVAGPLTGTVAYTQTDDRADYRSPYGSWAGYTSMIVKDFDRAGERALLLGAALDFAKFDLAGLSFFTNFVFGRNAISPATGQPASRNSEYDFTLDYRFTAANWPDYVKPFWIRLRAAHIEEKVTGNRAVTNDYRAILNYEWVFKQK